MAGVKKKGAKPGDLLSAMNGKMAKKPAKKMMKKGKK